MGREPWLPSKAGVAPSAICFQESVKQNKAVPHGQSPAVSWSSPLTSLLAETREIAVCSMPLGQGDGTGMAQPHVHPVVGSGPCGWCGGSALPIHPMYDACPASPCPGYLRHAKQGKQNTSPPTQAKHQAKNQKQCCSCGWWPLPQSMTTAGKHHRAHRALHMGHLHQGCLQQMCCCSSQCKVVPGMQVCSTGPRPQHGRS